MLGVRSHLWISVEHVSVVWRPGIHLDTVSLAQLLE